MTVELRGSLRPLIAALELLAGDRYRRPAVGETPEVLVVEPLARGRLDLAASSAPGALIVVWDRREAATPLDIARVLDGAAVAFVSGGSAAMLIGQLDALLRHREFNVAPVLRDHSTNTASAF